eukprot:1294683-Pyramimonas_sp.AAC.1
MIGGAALVLAGCEVPSGPSGSGQSRVSSWAFAEPTEAEKSRSVLCPGSQASGRMLRGRISPSCVPCLSKVVISRTWG